MVGVAITAGIITMVGATIAVIIGIKLSFDQRCGSTRIDQIRAS